MVNRRQLMAGTIHGLTRAGFAPALFAAEPWPQEEVIPPADLAKRIEAGAAPTMICVAFPFLYRQRHVRGATFAGPTNTPEGIQDLEKLAATLSKDSEVVVYCGCCPMKDCPNIRPAYETLKKMGFKVIRVLTFLTICTTTGRPKAIPASRLRRPALGRRSDGRYWRLHKWCTQTRRVG
jgi:hypothetical protein